jgi:hypothetical protein
MPFLFVPAAVLALTHETMHAQLNFVFPVRLATASFLPSFQAGYRRRFLLFQRLDFCAWDLNLGFGKGDLLCIEHRLHAYGIWNLGRNLITAYLGIIWVAVIWELWYEYLPT